MKKRGRLANGSNLCKFNRFRRLKLLTSATEKFVYVTDKKEIKQKTCFMLSNLGPPMRQNGLKPFNTQSRLLMTLKKKPFENIMKKGENAGTNIFTFSHNVFYPSKSNFSISIIFVLSSANACKFGKV